MIKTNKVFASNLSLILMFLLLILSGNGALIHEGAVPDILRLLMVVTLSAFVYLYAQIRLRKIGLILCWFISVIAIQIVQFQFCPYLTYLSFLTTMVLAFMVCAVLGHDFIGVYVKVMVYLAIISLTLHLLQQVCGFIGFNFSAQFQPISNVFIEPDFYRIDAFIHTYTKKDLIRNAGMFWEPGVFSGYLTLAIIFLYCSKNSFSKRAFRRNICILIFTLLTTMSTTGYIVLSVIIFFIVVSARISRNSRSLDILITMYIFLPIACFSIYLAYERVPFLKEKISGQLRYVDNRSERWHRGRFGTLLFDWEYIKRKPFSGWGVNKKTRYALNPEMIDKAQGMGNGFTHFAAQFGVISLLIYLTGVYISIARFYGSYNVGFVVLLVVILNLQGEQFLNMPFYYCLMFIRSDCKNLLNVNIAAGNGRRYYGRT